MKRLPSRRQSKDNDNFESKVSSQYRNCKLAQDLLLNHHIREEALQKHRSHLKGVASGHDSWLRTVFILQGRAFDVCAVPWLLVTLNAIIWAFLSQVCDIHVVPLSSSDDDNLTEVVTFKGEFMEGSTSIFDGNATIIAYESSSSSSSGGAGLNSAAKSAQVTFIVGVITFLVVFRLNRASLRWWDVRKNWGVILAETRILVNTIMTYAGHSLDNRDSAVRWAAAFLVATKQFLRDERAIDPAELAGFLTEEQVKSIETVKNLPLFCIGELRFHLAQAFAVDEHTPISLATKYTSDLRRIEESVHSLNIQVGGMERVKATPLGLGLHLLSFSISILNGHMNTSNVMQHKHCGRRWLDRYVQCTLA
mmetsp:Transcript_23879/g.36825  ORF Transcript_23879/g.36825 Transcript_23879/m.36825 type:complete len:365 (+) Transcript_23879:83-1177(+)|eukprot:CAMPEP_0196809514 /NCGR_PEP_ID=MMETSP1362-20130617/9428_1 /TAXON_ID=163516 /ORGANISM="Leptocylindrus danicus, Strain CCMP1856" /LENGTH=364 /DNA_ID=CAMNT_0042184229 /DNA_START=51 /DNA_END=1145 /DNA_ORIENTATION=-